MDYRVDIWTDDSPHIRSFRFHNHGIAFSFAVLSEKAKGAIRVETRGFDQNGEKLIYQWIRPEIQKEPKTSAFGVKGSEYRTERTFRDPANYKFDCHSDYSCRD